MGLLVTIDVPCNGCSDNWELKLHPDHDDPDHWITYERDGNHYLGRSIVHGGCVYLVDNRCSIYSDRPWVCRTFDCRVLFAVANTTGKVPDVPYRVKLGALLCMERT